MPDVFKRWICRADYRLSLICRPIWNFPHRFNKVWEIFALVIRLQGTEKRGLQSKTDTNIETDYNCSMWGRVWASHPVARVRFSPEICGDFITALLDELHTLKYVKVLQTSTTKIFIDKQGRRYLKTTFFAHDIPIYSPLSHNISTGNRVNRKHVLLLNVLSSIKRTNKNDLFIPDSDWTSYITNHVPCAQLFLLGQESQTVVLVNTSLCG